MPIAIVNHHLTLARSQCCLVVLAYMTRIRCIELAEAACGCPIKVCRGRCFGWLLAWWDWHDGHDVDHCRNFSDTAKAQSDYSTSDTKQILSKNDTRI